MEVSTTSESTALPERCAADVPILLVEDDELTRDALRMILEEEGYAVGEADSAAMAMAYLRVVAREHVVLLDWLLLNSSDEGGAILRQVEQDAALRRHRYVLLTAAELSKIADDERRLIAAYCAEVISKPFDIVQLLDTIAAVAARAADRAEGTS